MMTILFGFATGVSIGVYVVSVAIVVADNKSLVIVLIYARSLTIVFLAYELCGLFIVVQGSFQWIENCALSDNSEPSDRVLHYDITIGCY